MKRAVTALLLTVVLFFASCGTLKNAFSAQDAEGAIRELLSFGTQHGGDLLSKKGAFSKETLMSTLLPEDLSKVLNTLETLGLSKEINKFSTTLATCAEQTAEKSVPIFLMGIKKMNISDAFNIVKNGGTACTDYLRKSIGDTLRKAIAPTMSNALNEYKVGEQWNTLTEPAKLFAGNKLNLDLGNLMSGLVANLMFKKIEEKEMEIRTRAEARKTVLLQKVFGQVANKIMKP